MSNTPTPTLPETMVGAIKELMRAYEVYCAQVDAMIAVRDGLRTQLDRLTTQGTRHPKPAFGAKPEPGLDTLPTDMNVPVTLPPSIVPLPPKEDKP